MVPVDRVPIRPDDVPALLDQFKATPPDGLVYLTLNPKGRLLADWRSNGEQTTFEFAVGDEPLDA